MDSIGRNIKTCFVLLIAFSLIERVFDHLPNDVLSKSQELAIMN